jgi:hypothetical protein
MNRIEKVFLNCTELFISQDDSDEPSQTTVTCISWDAEKRVEGETEERCKGAKKDDK